MRKLKETLAARQKEVDRLKKALRCLKTDNQDEVGSILELGGSKRILTFYVFVDDEKVSNCADLKVLCDLVLLWKSNVTSTDVIKFFICKKWRMTRCFLRCWICFREVETKVIFLKRVSSEFGGNASCH